MIERKRWEKRILEFKKKFKNENNWKRRLKKKRIIKNYSRKAEEVIKTVKKTVGKRN